MVIWQGETITFKILTAEKRNRVRGVLAHYSKYDTVQFKFKLTSLHRTNFTTESLSYTDINCDAPGSVDDATTTRIERKAATPQRAKISLIYSFILPCHFQHVNCNKHFFFISEIS